MKEKVVFKKVSGEVCEIYSEKYWQSFQFQFGNYRYYVQIIVKHRGLVFCSISVKEDLPFVSIGHALCNQKDEFSIAKGIKIAASRALVDAQCNFFSINDREENLHVEFAKHFWNELILTIGGNFDHPKMYGRYNLLEYDVN